MDLYLVEFNMQTTYNPGDDGMMELPAMRTWRIVEAEDEVSAGLKIKLKYEQYKPYNIRITVSEVEVHSTIR